MIRSIAVLIMMWSLCSFASSQTITEYEILSVVPGAITIDGSIDDAAWKGAVFTNDFVILATGAKPVLRTRSKLLWDADNLYVAFDAVDTDMYAKETVQDAEFYSRDDLVEVYVDPNGDGKNYLELGVSARGTNYDYIIINPTENNWQDDKVWDIKNCSVKVVARGTLGNASDTDSGWTAEIKIPFVSLDYANFGISLPVKAGDSWRGNLCRYDYDCSSNVDEFNEEDSWVKIGNSSMGPHTPGKFGTFKFSATQVTAVKENVLPQSPDRCFRIYNRGGSAETILFQVDKQVSRDAAITMYSLSGRQIETIPLNSQSSVLWSVNKIPSGLYICQFYDGGIVDVQSIIVE